MSPYVSNTTLEQIADALEDDVKSVVLTTHAKPDGDALGAVVALGRALEKRGKQVERWIIPPLTPMLRVLTGEAPVKLVGPDGDAPSIEPDRIVVVDTGAWSQLEPLKPWLQPRSKKVIVIDHHLRGDAIGDMLYVDAHAAAACEIIANLIDVMGVDYDPVISPALYVGVASDTGWFRFSNTRAETFELAARLLRQGVNHAALHAKLEQGERPEKLQLMIRALDSLKLIADGRAAVMVLRESDFADTGARQEETERFVDLPQIVHDVQAVVLIAETPENGVRMSFRSKPGPHSIN
ncbi:MAG: bifunctional oligoribonuclease/PAP phosphatase NrnA, partial [Phycisphaeraceae bacterium]